MTAFPGRLEIAPGADRAAPPASYAWTDITADTADSTVAVTRGRAQNSSEAAPGSLTIRLRNADGQYTPRHPLSTYYPNIKQGLPVRYSRPGGLPFLRCTGAPNSYASTPDATAIDITGDLAGVIELEGGVGLPRTGQVWKLAGKYTTSGNQRSWYLRLDADGTAMLSWSPDGTAAAVKTAATTITIPRPDAGPWSLGWRLDVDNGAAGWTVTWYYARGGVTTLLADLTGNQLGSPVTAAGTTSIFNSTSALWVGDVAGITTDAVFLPAPVKVRRLQLRAGDLSTGTIKADISFTAQTPGATSFVDAAGLTWTVAAAAAVTNERARLVGELTANRPIWPGHGQAGTAQVQWDIAGPLRRMRQGAKALASTLYRHITAPSRASFVQAYWPMEDGSEATGFASPIAGVKPGFFSGPIGLAADSTLNSSSALPSVPGGDSAGWGVTVPNSHGSSGSWRVDLFAFIKTPSSSTPTVLMVFTTDGSAVTWRVAVDDTNYTLRIYDADGTQLDAQVLGVPSGGRLFNTWVLWSVKFEQVGSDTTYTFNVVPLPAGVAFGASGTVTGKSAHRVKKVQTLLTAPPDGVSFGHLAVTNPDQGLGWLAPADTAYAGEPAPSRIFRLCQEQGIDCLVDGEYGTAWTADHSINFGAVNLGPQRPLPLLTLLQNAADADHGYLGETREALGLTYRSSTTLYNQAPRLTAGVEVTNPFEPADDDQHLVNDGTVTRPNAGSARFVAPAPNRPEDIGLYDASREANVETDGLLADQASWWVTEACWEEMRYPSIPLELAKAGAPLDDWLAFTVGDVLEADTLPSTHPTGTVDQLVEGYTETNGPTSWQVVANGVPAGPWTVGALDVATGRLNTSGSTLATTVNSSATSWSVASASSTDLWTTAGGDFPFDIVIGGERVTVTAISGAASPQTFTVTRSANGVVKGHTAGDAIEVADPIVLTL